MTHYGSCSSDMQLIGKDVSRFTVNYTVSAALKNRLHLITGEVTDFIFLIIIVEISKHLKCPLFFCCCCYSSFWGKLFLKAASTSGTTRYCSWHTKKVCSTKWAFSFIHQPDRTPHGTNSLYLNACALFRFSGTRSVLVSSCLPIQDDMTAFVCELQC